MKYYIIALLCIAIYSKVQAQLTLETSINGGMNAMYQIKDFHEKSPHWEFTPPNQYIGFNIGGTFGTRLYLLDKKWSIGLGVGYLYRYHESGFIYKSERNVKHKQDFLTIPLDIGYHFQSGWGLHGGVEASWYISPYHSNPFVDVNKGLIISPFVGVSYTYKRFRFELLYKHSLHSIIDYKYPLRIDGVSYTDYRRTRYQDLELRVVFRLYEFGEIKM
jgi:hypothetical protein